MASNMSPEEKLIAELLETYHFKRTPKTRTVYRQGPSLKKKLFKALPKLQGPVIKTKKVLTLPVLQFRSRTFSSVRASGEINSVADQLTHIVDSVPPPQNESLLDRDTDFIQRLVYLLKESGDKLNEKIQKDRELLGYLQNSFSYSLFENLASAFIGKVVPANQQDKEEQKIKIAWAFEMTSRVSALNLQPMNRVMGFGAQYVHHHFAPWVQQHGGWEKAFNGDESDEVQ